MSVTPLRYLAIALLSLPALLLGNVIRVPADLSTIQAALDAIADQDTVLVANGEYLEHLLAPPFTFYLLGDVPIDTGDFARPIIDPSTLIEDSACALRLVVGSRPYVERIRFHNQLDMFNRSRYGGGVYLEQGDSATFRYCAFDSTYLAFYQDWHHHADFVELDHCVFRYYITQTDLRETSVHAHDCLFADLTWTYSLVCGSNSTIESCHFAQSRWTYLTSSGGNAVVEDCVFGPGGPHESVMVYLDDFKGRFANNLLQNSTIQDGVDVFPALPAGAVIEGNTFYNLNRVPPVVASVLCVFCNTDDNGAFYQVKHNVMQACTLGTFSRAIRAKGHGMFTNNRIYDLGSPTIPAILMEGDNVAVFHDNLIFNTGLAMRANLNGAPLDARLNWWGDSTGPYNANANPQGTGEEVGNNILFDPWLQDSSLIESVTSRPPLPTAYTLSVYPNPFNSQTRLRFSAVTGDIYQLDLFDLLGRKVQSLWKGPALGVMEVEFDARELASGIYFARLTQSIYLRPLATTKLVLMK
jgi:hypothetical protein